MCQSRCLPERHEEVNQRSLVLRYRHERLPGRKFLLWSRSRSISLMLSGRYWSHTKSMRPLLWTRSKREVKTCVARLRKVTPTGLWQVVPAPESPLLLPSSRPLQVTCTNLMTDFSTKHEARKMHKRSIKKKVDNCYQQASVSYYNLLQKYFFKRLERKQPSNIKKV